MRLTAQHIPLLIILAFGILLSCSKSGDDEILERDNSSIEKQLTNRNLKFTKHNNIYHAILRKGYGYRVAPGDTVAFWYVGYTFGTGGFVFDTNVRSVAEAASLDLSSLSLSPVVVNTQASHLIEGVAKGLLLCREKETASVLFSSIYGFRNQSIGALSPWTPLAYDIQIIYVINNHIREEQKNISNFVNQNEGFVQDTLGFWKRFESQSSTGYHPSIADTIFCWFSEQTLDGKVVAQAPEGGMQIIVGDDNYTEGLMFGLLQMAPNDILELVVPSSMGYGIQENTKVSPYTPLFYKLRLDSIK